MPDYIDRNMAIEMIKNDAPDLVYYNKEEAIDCLECVPTADVQEVKHGRWIRATTHGSYTCSICGAMDTDCDDYYGNHRVLDQQYCPDCGAKMDLEELENG